MKLLMPLGFALVSLQGLAELVKRIAALQGLSAEVATYEKLEQ
jgi:TRAP-type mannitol/chloroaromatic compound transport system permease small subunit